MLSGKEPRKATWFWVTRLTEATGFPVFHLAAAGNQEHREED